MRKMRRRSRVLRRGSRFLSPGWRKTGLRAEIVARRFLVASRGRCLRSRAGIRVGGASVEIEPTVDLDGLAVNVRRTRRGEEDGELRDFFGATFAAEWRRSGDA